MCHPSRFSPEISLNTYLFDGKITPAGASTVAISSTEFEISVILRLNFWHVINF